MALEDYQELIDNMVRDEAGEITTDQRDQALLLAVVRYSTDRPVTMVEEITSPGGQFLDLPAGWDNQFSRPLKLEIPDDDDGIEIGASIEQTLNGTRIRVSRTLAAGQILHFYYTGLHQLDVEGDTIPLIDREAVASWASALLLDQLSTLYSGSINPTLDADTVNFQSKGRDYASRAKAKRQVYLDHLGIDPKRTVAHGVVVDLDQEPTQKFGRITFGGTRR